MFLVIDENMRLCLNIQKGLTLLFTTMSFLQVHSVGERGLRHIWSDRFNLDPGFDAGENQGRAKTRRRTQL